jgi:hypothetical protein
MARIAELRGGSGLQQHLNITTPPLLPRPQPPLSLFVTFIRENHVQPRARATGPRRPRLGASHFRCHLGRRG